MDGKKELLAGSKAAIPIVLGYLPIGVAYGLLAVKAGLNIKETVSMSIFVFAGSSQLICVNMLSAGAGIMPIIVMTFLVNLRHILMSASLSLHFKQTSKRLLPLLGFIITDESFAVGSSGLKEQERKGVYFLGLGVTAYLGWAISSWLGSTLGGIFNIAELPGVDFVLPAMFIVLLVMQISKHLDILVSIFSGILSILFIYILPVNWNIILATVLAAICGVIIEKVR